jgi:hypothetical protein
MGPNLRKKRIDSNGCSITPPAYVALCAGNDAHAANKLVWILHPDHSEVPVAQGKTSVSWKSKSKLGLLCAEGEQWIHIF